MSTKKQKDSPYNVKELLAEMETLESEGSNLYTRVNTLANKALDHASYHHDFTLATRLVKAVEGFKGSRPKALRLWFVAFGPMSWSKQEDGTEGFKRNPDKTDYLVKQALKTPYWDLNPEKTPQEIDLKKLITYMKHLASKANGSAKGTVLKEGQEASSKAVADFILTQAIPFIESIQSSPKILDVAEDLKEEEQHKEDIAA